MSVLIKFPLDRVRASGVDGGNGVTRCKVIDLDSEKAYRFAAECEKHIKARGSVPYGVFYGAVEAEFIRTH